MQSLSMDLKGKIAAEYSENKEKLEALSSDALEAFATKLLEMIEHEKETALASHDLKVLEESMQHLKRDATTLGTVKPGSDDYDFAINDCKNLINSTRKWLKLEGLIASDRNTS